MPLDLGTQVACVIPCFNAGARVRPVVEQALLQTSLVIVVDDGSTDGSCNGLAALGARVTSHPQNRGKGHAILTGLRAALENEEIAAVILLDADGQHDPAAIAEFAARYRETSAGLVIGARVFTGGHVPFRSRFGNTVTAIVSRVFIGLNLPDTQCGYRLLSRSFASAVLERSAGGRYETEMEMLILAARLGVGIATTPIRTVYEAGNASSHFRKIHDSVRIYSTLLRAALRR